MNGATEASGGLSATGRRYAVVAARFNGRLVERLVEGAVDCLVRHGAQAADVRVVRVPGAWELPLAAEEVARGGGVDALVAVGVVIRGETPHFDHICTACTRGLGEVAVRHRIPVGFGVLTCNTTGEAEERAGGKAGNKGWDAALAAIEMSELLAVLRSGAG